MALFEIGGETSTTKTKAATEEERRVQQEQQTTGVTTTDQTQTQEAKTTSDIVSTMDQLVEAEVAGTSLTTDTLAATTEQQQEQAGTAFSGEVLDALASLLTQQIGGVAGVGGDRNAILSQLLQTAGGFEEAAGARNEAIIAGARQEGEQAVGRQSVLAAQQAGSSMNSIVQSLQQEGRNQLEVALAALSGSLGSEAATGGINAMLSALTGTSVSDITGLATSLKGGETTAAGVTTGEQVQTGTSAAETQQTTAQTTGTETAQTETGTSEMITALQSQTQNIETVLFDLVELLKKQSTVSATTDTARAGLSFG